MARWLPVPDSKTVIYKFKSKATGDLIMLAAHGDQALRLMGREPAGQGIIEVAAMPAALAALQAAIAAQESAQKSAPQKPQAPAAARHETEADDSGQAGAAVALRQRLWPLIDTLRRAHEAGVPLVWGV